ncbi:hypothetical protein D1155_10940 [Anaerotruncus sp. 80]|uniref:Uncharacterized protein n=1 Tax=Anaerotruncus colihominis TaxID=169435 RepID=A0A845QN91_9FIRM|nr:MULTISPECIES: hypothetical protein [Clostridia]NBH62167.1 hypothetical protein [Anaerotruncus colihominis]NCE99653.1 hypothetical protein [Emergencia sp. 1XD21-10]NCF02822.1 hypothetical protein [Anaerotruncus sp. 80]
MLLRRHKQDRLTRTSELEKPMDLDVTPNEAANDSSQEANNAQNVVSPEDAPVPEEDKKVGDKSGPTGKGKGKA